MGDFTGHEIRKTYERVLQNQHGIIHDGFGNDISSSIHSLTVSNDLTVKGDIRVSGSITAETYYVTRVTSSVQYQSGSTQFGDTPDDTHTMMGSLTHIGSVTRTGNNTFTGNTYQTGSTYQIGDTNQTGSIRVAGGNIVANPGVFMNPSTYSSDVFVPEYFNAGMYGPISNAATIQVSNHSKLRIFP